jgi:hypothetical protein
MASLALKNVAGLAVLAAMSAGVEASNYDATTADALAYVAAAAYCDPGPVQSWSCLACTKSPITVSNAIFMQDSTLTNFAFVGQDESDGSVVLSYRGSDDIQQVSFHESSPCSCGAIIRSFRPAPCQKSE